MRIERFMVQLWLALVVGSAALGAAIGLLHSVPMSIFLGIVFVVSFIVISHNWNFLLPRLRERDDLVVLKLCEAGAFSMFRRIYRWLPADPRCRVCLVPFGGIGKILRIRPSRKNSNLCTECMEAAPVGVHDLEAGILHADLRGFTAWSESKSPSAVAAFLSRYYSTASRVLSEDDALIECVGDQIMAIYLPVFPSLRGAAPAVMLRAAGRLIAALEADNETAEVGIGVGIHFGTASVGNIAKGAEKDFTAAGDVVNTAARLQSWAESGQVVVSAEVARELGQIAANSTRIEVEAKGKSDRIEAYAFDAQQIVAADL